MIFPVGVEGAKLRGLPWFSLVFVALCLLVHLVVGGDSAGEVSPLDVQDVYVDALYQGHVGVELPEACAPTDTGSAAELDAIAEELRASVGDTGLAEEWAEDSTEVQARLDELCAASGGGEADPVRRWGLVGDKGLVQAGWVTYLFLHADWFHLLGNLLFFVLICGPVLEDVYRAPMFGAFFVVAGIVAGLAEVVLLPDGSIPIIGASGAIAACTGAFCTRFARRKTGFAYAFLIVFRPVYGTFAVPAWVAGSFWLVQDVLYQFLVGSGSGVAYMAHIGGMVFGVGAALAIRMLGWEERFGLPLDDAHWRLPEAEPEPPPKLAPPRPAEVIQPGSPEPRVDHDAPIAVDLTPPAPQPVEAPLAVSEESPEATPDPEEPGDFDEDEPITIDW